MEPIYVWVHICLSIGARDGHLPHITFYLILWSVSLGFSLILELRSNLASISNSPASTLYSAGITGSCITTQTILCGCWAFKLGSSRFLSKHSYPLNHVSGPSMESFKEDICMRTFNTADAWKQRLNTAGKFLIL